MTSQTTFTSCMHDQMLESNRDDVKLEAMRCVTVMTAKGKLSVPRTLFPHIVKNVSSKNPELKKLIYLYLTNFADQEPDLALLPVASLQKSLKSPNPLVRSSALKVLTSMRLNILSAILMATLRNSVNDLSPYVRKTVAHSIIKIYRLDTSLRPDLIEYIERLFNDKNSMVLSSAMASYEVVCPERLDLVQKHYRRFCFILADCNEWGQTLMLNLLVRYILKTCTRTKNGITGSTENDPKILLRSAKPLVHSNNSAVVMAVVRLFIAIAGHNEVRSTITRPLIRLLCSHREIQLVVLKMIEDLTTISGDEKSTKDDEDVLKRADKSINPDSISLPKSDISNTQPPGTESSPDIPSTDDGDSQAVGGELSQSTRDGYIALEDGSSTTSQSGRAANTNEDNLKLVDSENNIEGNQVQTKSYEEGEEHEQSSDSDDDSTEDESDDEDEEDDESDEDDDEEEEEEDEDDSEDETQSGQSDRHQLSNNKNAINNGDGSIPKGDDSEEGTKDFGTSFIDLSGNKDPSAYIEIFRPYIKSFYIRNNDCTQIRLAKLRILTNLSAPVNVSQILRELQTYISIYVDDKEFVSAAIHAIGRCAIIVKEVAHTCLNGLTTLLSNNNEHIVSEAIVVLRSQIINKKTSKKSIRTSDREDLAQSNTREENKTADGSNSTKDQDDIDSNPDDQIDEHEEADKMVSAVIKQVTKLLPKVTAPQARATILWILAEFCDKNLTAAKSAPNVLRMIAKSFSQEDNFVKLQSLTLASKFILSLDKEKKADLYDKVRLLANYLFSLAKYDINHDVRDRGRFLRKLLEDEVLCAKVLNGLIDVDDEQKENSAVIAA